MGVSVGIGSIPNPIPGTEDTPYPTGTVTTLAITTVIPWAMLAYVTFRFRRVLAQYLRNRFEYLLSNRTDLVYQFEYRMLVGSEYHSTVLMSSGLPLSLELVETSSLPPGVDDEIADSELSEVVVD